SMTRDLMMSWFTMKNIGMTAATLFISAMLVGCEEKGPAQKAGENLDKGVQNLKDSVDPRGPAEKVGGPLDKARGRYPPRSQGLAPVALDRRSSLRRSAVERPSAQSPSRVPLQASCG